MENKIQIVFDTSYLESKNYNYKSSIFERIKIGVKHHKSIDVYLPQNVDREIRAHLLNTSLDISEKIKKLPAILRNEILKISFQGMDNLHNEINSVFMEQYEFFIDEFCIQVIENDKECTSELWDRYFLKEPPFTEKKKNEFSDAMALLSTCKYLQGADRDSIIFVSNDNDWKMYCKNKGLCFVNNDKNLIEELNKRCPILEKADKIGFLNENTKNCINRKIEQHFDCIKKEPTDDSGAIDFEILDFSIQNISDCEIVSIDGGDINLLYNVEYSVEVKYLNQDSWHRDFDSKDIFYTESVQGILESETIVEVNISLPGECIDKHDITDYVNIISPTLLEIDTSEMKQFNSKFGVYYY